MAENTNEQTVRWGILGAANIAQKNWLAIHNSGNGVVVAVASRSLDRAQEFVDRCQAEVPFTIKPDAIESYDALLSRDDIDAVYVPLPTGVRPPVVVAAANAGKHVVCEKPCADSAADLKTMTDACEKNGVQFMDGVMFRHSQRMNLLRSKIDDGKSVGRIKRITSQFSFFGGDEFKSNDIRARSELEKFGCLGDLGWYTALFTLWVMKFEMPKSLSATLLSSHKHEQSKLAVPTELSAELLFGNGVSAGFYCSFETQHQQWANISGTEGYLHVSDFVLPFAGTKVGFQTVNSNFDADGCNFKMTQGLQHHELDEASHSHETAQETNLFRNFGELVLNGNVDSHWADAATKTKHVVDACYESAFNSGKTITIG